MKRKELKNLAQKIAKAEMIVQTSTDNRAIENAKMDILTLSKKVNFEDLDILDEMITEILTKGLD